MGGTGAGGSEQLIVCGVTGVGGADDGNGCVAAWVVRCVGWCVCAQYGCTPLYVAARYGHEKVVAQLVQAKANVDVADEVGVGRKRQC